MIELLKNVPHFINGTFRNMLYNSRFKWLIPKLIRKQIKFRIDFMDKQCYLNGACLKCGCNTPALQMANKQCPKPCYPPFMSKLTWRYFTSEQPVYFGKNTWQLKVESKAQPKENIIHFVKISTLYLNGKVIREKKLNQILGTDPYK
jgi:hypothetical protein